MTDKPAMFILLLSTEVSIVSCVFLFRCCTVLYRDKTRDHNTKYLYQIGKIHSLPAFELQINLWIDIWNPDFPTVKEFIVERKNTE